MYYDGANWKWDKGDKMIDANFAKQILSDIDMIKETLLEIRGLGKVEKKEQRKLAEIICESFNGNGELSYLESLHKTSWNKTAKAAIDAVIECYHQWRKDDGAMMGNKPFPEYLKEKML